MASTASIETPAALDLADGFLQRRERLQPMPHIRPSQPSPLDERTNHRQHSSCLRELHQTTYQDDGTIRFSLGGYDKTASKPNRLNKRQLSALRFVAPSLLHAAVGGSNTTPWVLPSTPSPTPSPPNPPPTPRGLLGCTTVKVLD
ncbi:hypothetical protein FRC02_007137 [Tulasnella sp. 418]|nr:hypothetical protein FRC02_007137 [Tulasnella sp. 418]